jgi:hypothetical protein
MDLSLFKAATAAGMLISMAAVSQAQTPTPAQQQAIRSNCVADYRANCASVPTGGMDALICLEQHEAKLSPACRSAVEAVDHGGGSAAPENDTGAPSAEAEAAKASGESERDTGAPSAEGAAVSEEARAMAAPEGGRPAMSLRQEMRLAARSCAHDYRLLCPNLPVGQGNILFCLKVHANRLSEPCRNALIEAGEMF